MQLLLGHGGVDPADAVLLGLAARHNQQDTVQLLLDQVEGMHPGLGIAFHEAKQQGHWRVMWVLARHKQRREAGRARQGCAVM